MRSPLVWRIGLFVEAKSTPDADHYYTIHQRRNGFVAEVDTGVTCVTIATVGTIDAAKAACERHWQGGDHGE